MAQNRLLAEVPLLIMNIMLMVSHAKGGLVGRTKLNPVNIVGGLHVKVKLRYQSRMIGIFANAGAFCCGKQRLSTKEKCPAIA